MSRRGARRPPRRSPPLCCPFRSRPGANLAPRSDFQPLERRPRVDDVALELELGLFQPGGDAHELGEVEDRQLEGASGGGLELLLPRVERQMAEGAGSHHHVRAGLERLLDGLDELAHRRLLARLDDREPAALDLRGVVDRLAAARLDDALERPRAVGILEAHDLRRAQDLAAVERRHLQALQPLVRRDLEQLVAVALRDLPQQVANVDLAAVRGNADGGEIPVHALAQRVVALEHEVRLTEVERAHVADRQQRVAAGRLRIREDARVQVEVVIRLRLVDVARAAARDRLQLDELEADARRERLRRRVELLRRERGEAALVVRNSLHSVSSGRYGFGNEPGPYGSPPSWWPCSSFASARSPWMWPNAPWRSCSRTILRRLRASLTSFATCGGKASPALLCLTRFIANFICFTDDTMPWVFGTSSVSRSHPVVSVERMNHFACFAPMSRSMPLRIASAPSFAIASRGSTPLGQRSLQKKQRVHSQIPCSPLYCSSRSTVAPSRGSPTKRMPFASACGPRNSGSDSIALHSETQQPQLMQSASFLIASMRGWSMRYSRPSSGRS